MIQLGDQAMDVPTGFVGVVTAVAVYLGGAIQLRLEQETPTGDPKERWIPEGRARLVSETPTVGFAFSPPPS